MRIGDKLISNTVYLFLDWLLVSLFSFIFWFILGKTHSPSDVGIVAISINLILLISSFSTLGITNALKKLIPEFKEKKGLEAVYPIIKLSFKPILISLVITFIILLVFSNQFSFFVKIPYYAFLLCIISIIVISIYDVFGSVLYGLQNMRKLFLTDFAQIVIRVLFTGLLISLVFNYFLQYKDHLYLFSLISFLSGYFLILFFRFNFNYLNSGLSISYKKLFFYSTPALISTVASTLMLRGEYIILVILENTEITGIFTIAFTITSVIGILATTPSSGIYPIISALSVNKQTKRKQGYLIGLVIRYSLFLTLPLSLLLMFF